MAYLQTEISELLDTEIFVLLQELERVTGQSTDDYLTSSLFYYLSSCLYNNAHGKRLKIDKDELDSIDPTDSFILRRKLRSFATSPIYQMCDELVKSHNDIYLNESAEKYDGSTLYVFLNQKLPETGKKKKKKPFRF